jgi:hypothetical protein
MMRCALGAIVALLVAAAPSAAATLPAFWLHDGQTRYLLPGEAHLGAVVRCVAHGKSTDAPMPPLPSGRMAGGTDTVGANGPALSIDRRPNGATQLRCGTATAGSGFFGRVTRPYVIGQNGLGLIRGANRLAAIERLYGAPSSRSVASGHCRADWRRIGLRVTFAGPRCAGTSVLAGAVAHGDRWSSLNGVRVGDPVAQMLWSDQAAKALAPGRWLLASGGVSHTARLVAVAVGGRLVSLQLTGD